jgi:hypothetical protein
LGHGRLRGRRSTTSISTLPEFHKLTPVPSVANAVPVDVGALSLRDQGMSRGARCPQWRGMTCGFPWRWGAAGGSSVYLDPHFHGRGTLQSGRTGTHGARTATWAPLSPTCPYLRQPAAPWRLTGAPSRLLGLRPPRTPLQPGERNLRAASSHAMPSHTYSPPPPDQSLAGPGFPLRSCLRAGRIPAPRTRAAGPALQWGPPEVAQTSAAIVIVG